MGPGRGAGDLAQRPLSQGLGRAAGVAPGKVSTRRATAAIFLRMNNNIMRPLLLVAALAALTGCERAPETAAQTVETAAYAAQVEQGAESPEVVVYKSPTCGCCSGWVDHMRENGFDVRTVDLVAYNDLAAKKREQGVPNDLGSCHTATVGDYVVEGHVPAETVQRLLEERPDVHGVAVPGMPTGSPGMPGPNPQPYEVIAFDTTGERQVFERIDPTQPASDAR